VKVTDEGVGSCVMLVELGSLKESRSIEDWVPEREV
jgi:hypothetical protein